MQLRWMGFWIHNWESVIMRGNGHVLTTQWIASGKCCPHETFWKSGEWGCLLHRQSTLEPVFTKNTRSLLLVYSVLTRINCLYLLNVVTVSIVVLQWLCAGVTPAHACLKCLCMENCRQHNLMLFHRAHQCTRTITVFIEEYRCIVQMQATVYVYSLRYANNVSNEANVAYTWACPSNLAALGVNNSPKLKMHGTSLPLKARQLFNWKAWSHWGLV